MLICIIGPYGWAVKVDNVLKPITRGYTNERDAVARAWGMRGAGEAVMDCNETRHVRENNSIWADVNGNDYAYY